MKADLRFIVWLALPALGTAATVAIRGSIQNLIARRTSIGVAWATLASATWGIYIWLAPKELEMAMEKTHTIQRSGFHEQFTVGECSGGIPEVASAFNGRGFSPGRNSGACQTNINPKELLISNPTPMKQWLHMPTLPAQDQCRCGLDGTARGTTAR